MASKPAKSKPAPKAQVASPKTSASNRPEPHRSAKVESLEPYRADPRGKTLTTNQGLPIADDENSLRAGERGPTLLEDFILREKITHFDHERIPERVVHARGAAAHGYFQVYESMAPTSRSAGFLQDPSSQDARVRALLDRRRFARLGRYAARRARVRREVLHAGRQLRPRRQQHARFFHSRFELNFPISCTRSSPSRITRFRRLRPLTIRSGISFR